MKGIFAVVYGVRSSFVMFFYYGKRRMTRISRNQ